MKTKKRVRRLLSLWLSLVMIVSNLAGLMPGMSLTVYADDPYASIKNTITVITFDSKPWYLIDCDSSTVTLLAKECVAASQYNLGTFVDYSNSIVKSAVDTYYNNSISTDAKTAVDGNGMFLLTTAQANAITNADVRKCPRFTGVSYNGWWLCSHGNGDAVAYVAGSDGYVDGVGGNYVEGTLGVRPALKLDLSKVTFDATSNTFSVGSAEPATAYADYLPKDTDDLAEKVVKFNGYNWYLINDNSTSETKGTVTLLAADDAFGTSEFHGSSNVYSSSTVKDYLDTVVAGNAGDEKPDFSGVADAIETIPSLTTVSYDGSETYDTAVNVKLYLLSKQEADALPGNVRNTSSEYWLRSPGDAGGKAAFVSRGEVYGDVNFNGYGVSYEFGVRPALKLDLSKVTFDATTKTFSVGSAEPATAYADYLPKDTDDTAALAAKVVKFNGYDWYLINDNSTSETKGTVTLLAADNTVGTSIYHDSSNVYSSSTVKDYLNRVVAGNAGDEKPDFSGVADAIETIPSLTTLSYVGSETYDTAANVKLYLLSVQEAGALPVNVRKASDNWWLRSPGDENGMAAYVYGFDGYVGRSGYYVNYERGVRPALTLNLSSVIFSSESKTFTLKPAEYSVTITPGSNMTKTTSSGLESQTGLSGAMTPVVYTTNTGYYFPTNYSVTAVNDITVTRDSYTQITVSGTPTADTTITLTAPTAKTTPAAPTTAAAVDCTTSDNNDGKLTGVTAAMEYKKSDAADWTAGTGSDITGLVPGTYYVRVKATETTNASTNQELTIKGFISYTVTFKVVNGKWNEGEGDAATADKTVTLTGHDGDTLKLTADQIPMVGTKPNDTYKAGSWDVTPSTDTAITEATTYTYTYVAKEASVVTKAPEAKTLTYNGSAQELVTAGTATGGEMQYALGTEIEATQPYTTSIPAKTDAGSYYVWYKVKGDANHADSTPVCITVTIEAASLSDRGVTVYAIPDQNYTGEAIEPKPVVKYLGYLLKEGTDYTLSYTNNTARWESGADQPAVTITGMGNYSGTLTAGFKIIVPAYEGILSLSLQGSITYGTPLGYAPEVMSTGNLNGETTNVYYSNSNSGEGTLWDSTKILNAGTWYVWAELDATTAHDKAVSKRQTLTVNKAQYETPVARILPEQTDASYEVSVVLPAGAKNTDYEYAITAGTSVVSEWSTLPVIKGGSFAPAGLSADTEYTISLRRKADANHFASEAVSKTFSTPAQVVLSYDANGGSGSVSASKAYTSGDNTDPLDNGSGISRYGYSFAGWNTMADGSGYSYAAGEVFKITASTTLYAKWTPDNYTVSFNANGGTGSMADQNFTWGTAQALNANAFTKTFYTFAGWSDSAAGAVVYTDTQKVNNLAAGGTVTLYAVWLENSYSVSGNVMEYLDGSTEPGIVADVSVKLMRGSVQFGRETKTDSKGEYSFSGVTAGTYNIVASKSGTSADDSRTMTALVTVSDSDKTVDTIYLPAQKVNSVVTVSENTPAVMVGELDEVAKENAENGKTVTVTMSVEAKDESAAEGAEELKALAESNSVTGADVEVDYLAISINKIVSANSAPTLTTAITETEQVLEIIVPFNFEGRKNCGIWRYHQDEAQGFEKLDTRPASAAGFRDATFYEDRENSSLHLYGAFFSTYAISYETSSDVTILFKANDGTDTQKTQTITLGAAAALTANSFSRSGYSFTGWNTEADGSGTAYTDQQAITATADLLLYAQWQQNPPAPGPTYFSISFEMNGHGTQIPSKSVAYGAKLEKPEDPIEEGFIFGGWFTDEGLTQEYDFTQAVTSGFKLYAKWTEQTKPGVSLNSISICTPPAKTEYVEGEKFDPTGMVVSANYTDNSSREVTTYTYTPSGNLAVSDNEITVSYTEEGITRTATQKISVSANITPPGPGPEPGPAEEVDLWNLFEDDSVHEYTVSGVAGGDSIANSNTKSAAFFDAVLDGDTISVSLKSGADRKKAANKANTVLSFALEDGSRVEYLLPVKYVKPSLKLSTKSVSIKEGSKAEVETTILIKAAGNGYEPMDLDGAEVKFNGADADILENGKIRVIAEAAGSGKISVSKPGWESAIELAFTVKTVKKNVLSVDLGGAKYVTLNSNAKNQNFDFPVFLNGEAAGEVSILDKKDSGIATYADGVLTIAYPEAGVKAGSYNIILKTEDASCSVKVKVSDKELSKAVTLKVKSRYDVVSGEPMVITPVLKDVSGEITSVSLDKEGFSAELNENGNIVVNYEGSAYDVKHLDIGTLEFKLGISGADEEVTISLPKVKAKKSVPAVKAAKVTVAKDAAGDVIAVANIVCTYKGSDGRYHSIAPENVKITKLSKGTEAALSEADPTLVDITKLEKKSGTIKVALSFKGGMTKNVTIRVKKSK